MCGRLGHLSLQRHVRAIADARLVQSSRVIGETQTYNQDGHEQRRTGRWRRECPPNPQQVCLFTKHLEIERGACPQIDMQLVRDFVPARAAAPLAGEAARAPDGIAAKYLKRTSFGTRGSQVQILPVRPTFSMHERLGGPLWGPKRAFAISAWPLNESVAPLRGHFSHNLPDYESGGQEFESLRARHLFHWQHTHYLMIRF
jgi:hypothetical protein